MVLCANKDKKSFFKELSLWWPPCMDIISLNFCTHPKNLTAFCFFSSSYMHTCIHHTCTHAFAPITMANSWIVKR